NARGLSLLYQGLGHRSKAPAPGTHRVHYIEQACGHGSGLGWLTVVETNRVRLVAGFRQFDLLLPVDGTASGFLAQLIPAMRATDAGHIVLAGAVFDTDGCTTGMTLIVVAFTQIVTHGNPVIEDKAVAAPLTFFLRYLFEVLQNAAFEVVHLVEALAEHVARSLLATNAASAEHGDFLVFGRIEVGFDVVRELAKTGGFRVDRAFEGADRDFIVVAGINQ